MPSILKIFDNEGVEIPIPAIQGPAGPNSVSTLTDSAITGLLKGSGGKVAQAVAGTDYAVVLSGATANRPTGVIVGSNYFDTTLGKPIWYKGAGVWVDSVGTTV